MIEPRDVPESLAEADTPTDLGVSNGAAATTERPKRSRAILGQTIVKASATVRDLIESHRGERICELIDGSLDGKDVLPGFRLPLKELFARADRSGSTR